MSFSDIALPGAVIADLYRTSLVQPGPLQQDSGPSKVKTEPALNNYKFLGNNHQRITIIVNFQKEAFLSDKQLQFLTKMLEACKLNLGDVAIVNHAKTPVEMEILRQQLSPVYVLLFDVEPIALKLPLNFPQFKEQAFAGISYLYTPSLDLLNQDTEEGKLLKSKLWVCLKKLFKV